MVSRRNRCDGNIMSALPLPPDDLGVFAYVRDRWKIIEPRVKNGRDVTAEIQILDRFLKDQQTKFAEGKLLREYDWRLDIATAENFHARSVVWMGVDQKSRGNWVAFYDARSKETRTFALQMAQDGMKYMLAVHGATAVTALNAIVSGKSDPYRGALIFAMVSAVVGMFMVGLGQIIMMNVLSNQAATIAGRLTRSSSWRSLRALGRWQNRRAFRQQLRLSDFLIYGSVIWFAVYVAACAALLFFK